MSTISTAFGYICLAIYTLLNSWNYNVEAYKFTPIVSLSFVTYTSSLAIMSLAFTVIPEIMPEKLKEFGVTVCITIFSASGFIILKFLPLAIELIGLHGLLFVFAGFTLLFAVFIILFIPETKGKSYEEIMKSLQ